MEMHSWPASEKQARVVAFGDLAEVVPRHDHKFLCRSAQKPISRRPAQALARRLPVADEPRVNIR